MNASRKPMFVERETYRKRRLRDAARFLPVVGIVLVLIPLLWVRGDETAFRTSAAIEYIFLIWLGLVSAGFLVALYLREEMPLSGTEDDEEGAPL